MNSIIGNITIVLVSFVALICFSQEALSQCKVDNSDPIKGQFSINGNKVRVLGDGGGSATAPNNIPIKICEGELITLRNTLPITSSTSNSYWIIEETAYTRNTDPIQSLISSIATSYTDINDSTSIKMIAKSVDPRGFNLYNGEGRYVIVQYDNTVAVAGGGGPHYACQVIQIIASQVPVITTSLCSGNEVKITFPSNPQNNYDDYEIIFKDTQGNDNQKINTGKPTTYPFTVINRTPDRNLTVKGVSITGNCNAPSSPNIPISLNPATIDRPIVSGIVGTTIKGEFKLAVSSQNMVNRNLYAREPQLGSSYDYTKIFKTYVSTASAADTIILQVPDGNKMYCFQAEALDLVCLTTLRSSEEICTTPANISSIGNKNVITWMQAPNGLLGNIFDYYQVERLNSNGTLAKLFPKILNVAELKIEDGDITCGNEYTYRVLTNYGQKSYSQIMKVKAVSNDIPSKISNVIASLTNDAKYASIQGNFNPANKPLNIKEGNFKYYRAESFNSQYSLMKIGNNMWNDSTTDVDKKSYCYYMTWTDLCDKESMPSEKVCTIHLQASGSSINWTKETSMSTGTDSYIVQRVNPTNGINIKELAMNLKNIYMYNTQVLPEKEGQEIYVRIESRPVGWNVIGGGSLESTRSNIVRIFRPSVMISPQIFTPNGDNNNDKFIVRGKFIRKLKMSIYDHWGNVIFYDEMDGYPTEDNQNETTVISWNGLMNNGNKALEGSYAFKIEVEDTIGQISTREGSLILAY